MTFLGDAPEFWIAYDFCGITIYYSGSGFEPYMEYNGNNWVKQ